jgi:hypothetical protein
VTVKSNQIEVQSNLSTTATLGTPQKWPLYISGRSVKVVQSKLVSKLAWPDLAWPLLTGGCCSEVVVNTGLTVLGTVLLGMKQLTFKNNCVQSFQIKFI